MRRMHGQIDTFPCCISVDFVFNEQKLRKRTKMPDFLEKNPCRRKESSLQDRENSV